MHVRLLGLADAGALMALRREALEASPLAFAASVDDDLGLSLEHVQRSLSQPDSSAIFGLFVNDEDLAGMVGLGRDSKIKTRHKAQIWGMYVRPGGRRRGGGRRLLEAAVEHARTWPGVLQVQLCVTESAEAARALYEAAGFREWGREPRALQWEGALVGERHMVLDLA